jgi:hypothetical protein
MLSRFEMLAAIARERTILKSSTTKELFGFSCMYIERQPYATSSVGRVVILIVEKISTIEYRVSVDAYSLSCPRSTERHFMNL